MTLLAKSPVQKQAALRGSKSKGVKNTKKNVTFVDLFAGIGGFHLGIQQAAKKSGIDAECVLAVDINKKARTTYSSHFTSTKLMEDVTHQTVKDSVPHDVDIIAGGFPCQPFSLAGKKLGEADDRGTLFMHIVQILKDKKPKAVFLENVRNLLNIENQNGQKTIEVIESALEEAGYPVVKRTFKATQFGLPTYRPRIYIVGFRKDVLANPDDFIWPDATHEKAATLKDYFKNLPSEWNTYKIARNGWPPYVGNTLRVGGAGSGFRDGGTRRDRRNWDSYMFYATDKDGSRRKKPHTLTVHEAKAMMGFPHDFVFPEEISSAQAMRQLGNSVAIPVIEAIAGNIIKTING